ncbi:hypothetical protein CSUI_001688 [Cystoisospora suis]|uniref:Uncharacterized protein n=1 Tax=Cystoisospora suis TaxID=483139 RepID=A0A2C6KK85_9APIC|nr:hypothetical protein CSUI_001688 [Cystoisospora suis]
MYTSFSRGAQTCCDGDRDEVPSQESRERACYSRRELNNSCSSVTVIEELSFTFMRNPLVSGAVRGAPNVLNSRARRAGVHSLRPHREKLLCRCDEAARDTGSLLCPQQALTHLRGLKAVFSLQRKAQPSATIVCSLPTCVSSESSWEGGRRLEPGGC